MKKFKKILSVLLVAVMIFGTAPLSNYVGFDSTKLNNQIIASAAYENTYKNTGNQRNDILEVAKTQLGNTNGLKYRADGNAWCAAFIVWCARQANIDSSIIKNTGWATADDLGITYYGRNADRTVGITYTPQPGDVIIFDWSSNGYCYKSPASNYGDHVGLVEYVSNGYVYTIEGNSGLSTPSVKRQSYSLSSQEIKGYGVPNYKSIHTHNFVTENEYAHPHKQYTKCYGCGEYSYTGNTLYRDSCNDCLALNYVDVWVSQVSNISDPELSEGLVGNNYYIWYKLANSQTGALYDSYGSLNYNAKISVYNPDGTKLHSCEYSNDNNWISAGLNQNGNYRINITITGDISANYDEYFTVRSNGILKFTPQTLNLDLKNKKTGSVELQTEGNFPEGSKAYLDVSNDNISYTRSGGTINVTALKSGKSEIKATAYDSNGTVLCTATAIINVTEPEYIIGYSGNGSTDVPDSQTKYYSSPLTISSYRPQRTGYTFVGWNTKSDGSGTSYNPGATYTENKSVKLYAQWIANSYTVSFYSNGELYSSKPVVYDSVYGTLPVPTRSGYIFNGWFTKSSGGTKITDSTIVSITANQTLYAHWTEIKLSSIKIKTVPAIVNYYVGDNLNTSGLALTAEYSDGTTKTITSGYTCTPAKLTTAGTQTITVDYNGKTATFAVTVSEIVKPDEPETKTYTVKWIIDDISIQQFLKVGDTIVEPSAPVKDGYEFVGWTPMVPVTMPDYDITFTAIFIEIKEPVTPDIPSEPIKSDVIKQPSQTTISYGDSIILHVDESKIPDGGNVMWSASNGNFSYSANGTTCTITPEKNGDTVFTATIYDADGNAVSTDEQTMTSKAGFFQKIIAFFKKLFGLTKTIPDIFKY